MTTQVEMKGRICPIISTPRDLIMCQGDKCVAFNSRPTKIFLAKDGGETTLWGETLRLRDAAGVKKPLPEDFVDQSKEIEHHVAFGWTRRGVGLGVHFTKEGPPDCWCEAMPANMECQGGGQ